MSVVGIDFGNQTCKIAVAHKGIVEVIANEVSNRRTPCMVAFDGRERRLGEAALTGIMSNYGNTVTEIKRLMGRKWKQSEFESDKDYFMYKTINNGNDEIAVEVSYQDKLETFTPEQIAGSLFGCLRRITMRALDTDLVHDCVITVPPYFSDVMRRSVLDAANIAGLNVLRLMNETTAVALQYGILRVLPEKEPIKVLFVDVGHASMNVAVASFVQGKLNILGTSSDRNLGGRNFDRALVAHLVQEIQQRYNLDVSASKKAMLRLYVGAERCKRILSANSEAPWNVECIMNDVDVSGVIDRATFEGLIGNLMERVLAPLKKVMFDTKLTKEKLSAIEVIGGSMRMPLLKSSIENFFGRTCNTTCDADESIARGAALQCAMLSPNFRVREFEVHDITPFPIEVGYGHVDSDIDDCTVLFEENNQIPSIKMISFHRSESFQVIARYQDTARLMPGVDPFLAKFVVSGLPVSADKKPVKTKIKIKMNINGILEISSAQALEEVASGEAVVDTKMKEDVPVQNEPTTVAAETNTDTPMETEADRVESSATSAPQLDPPTNEAAPKAEMDVEKPAKKKKMKRTDLVVHTKLAGGLDKDAFLAAHERECTMFNEDKVIVDTAAKRNDLESYVYEIRDKLSDDLSEYMADEPREDFISKLTEIEEWLYSDEGHEAQKSVYVTHYESIQAIGAPLLQKQFDTEHRDEHVAALKSAINRFQTFAQSDDVKYEHIDNAKKEEVLSKCTEADAWLTESISKQERLAKSDDCLLTVAALCTKNDELTRMAEAVMRIPKPKPTKVEETPAPCTKETESSTKMSDAESREAAESAASNADTSMPDANQSKAADEISPDQPEVMQVD